MKVFVWRRNQRIGWYSLRSDRHGVDNFRFVHIDSAFINGYIIKCYWHRQSFRRGACWEWHNLTCRLLRGVFSYSFYCYRRHVYPFSLKGQGVLLVLLVVDRAWRGWSVLRVSGLLGHRRLHDSFCLRELTSYPFRASVDRVVSRWDGHRRRVDSACSHSIE